MSQPQWTYEVAKTLKDALAEIERLRAYKWAWRQLSVDLRKDIANDAEGEWREVLAADCDDAARR